MSPFQGLENSLYEPVKQYLSAEAFSYITPKGCLTKKGMDNHEGDHSEYFPKLQIP